MENSKLIQRLKKPVNYLNPFSFGGGLKTGGISKENMDILMKVFSFDYMGAGEFEYGALPDALNRMIDNSSDLVKGSMTTHWKTTRWETREKIKGSDKIYFICYKEQRKEVKRRIASWATGNNISGTPKCGVRLDSSFDDREYLGWLELNNGFFFFIDEKMWRNTCELFDIKAKNNV